MRLSRPARRRIVAGPVIGVVLAGLTGVSLASDSSPAVLRGQSGDAVRCVQQAINLSPAQASVHGDDLSAGYFGVETENAVRVFQDYYRAQDPNIASDGVVGWREGNFMWKILRARGVSSWCFGVLPTNSAVTNLDPPTNLDTPPNVNPPTGQNRRRPLLSRRPTSLHPPANLSRRPTNVGPPTSLGLPTSPFTEPDFSIALRFCVARWIAFVK
jgi:peptidoglycan hydrolase-like protein with peptidoglycan-binding domain